MKTTNVFDWNLKAYNEGHDLIINQGGARAGKTYAILQILLLIAIYSKKNLVISVVAQTVPHLKKGAIRDFRQICEDLNINFDANFNSTDRIFKINNSIIEFFSVDKPGRAVGPGRDILFINECYYISFETYTDLAIRTKLAVFLDFNPLAKFWVHTEIIAKNIKHKLIHSTFADNTEIPKRVRNAILQKKGDNNWWRVYGLGLVGFSENILFNEGKLKRFKKEDLEKLDKNTFVGTFSYTDIAYGGDDYFCSIFADVYGSNVYVKDVIFNKHTIDLNKKLLIEKLKQHNVYAYGIETNAGGDAVGRDVYNEYENYYISVKSTANKITRIITEAVDIVDNFYFVDDIASSEYKLYFNKLTSFDTVFKNKNDDAPDTTAGLTKILRTNFFVFD